RGRRATVRLCGGPGYSLGTGRRAVSGLPARGPGTRLFDEHADGDELVGKTYHEERIAVGPSVNRAGEVGRRGFGTESLAEICGGIRLVEKGQRDVVALPPHPQLLEQRLQRMSRHDHV